MPYLPYGEPGITVILSLTAFLLLLNGLRYILNRLLYCGIIGEILLGVIWGLPVGGTAWLTEGTQEAIQSFGYLGLIGLVFEGGLSIDLVLLRKTMYMSISVATVGLLMPIALSFILLVLPFFRSSGTLYPTPLAAFSAGASLCSTSLGTTFAILSSANMQHTRVGVLLVGAAMMDDVVGLVMVSIVTTLGSGGTGGWPIARPIVASFGLLLVTLPFTAFVLRPIWAWLREGSGEGLRVNETTTRSFTNFMEAFRKAMMSFTSHVPHLNFLISTTVLIIFVAIASFIGASVLFSVFIAGGLVNHFSSLAKPQAQAQTTPHEKPPTMYESYYKPFMDSILVPFFFASIGFSIPITNMFTRPLVWKGIIYALLMVVAKGLVSLVIYAEYLMRRFQSNRPTTLSRRSKGMVPNHQQSHPAPSIQLQPLPDQESQPLDEAPCKPPHLMALLVGFAMIARGEIGFLIASLSQSSGTLTLRDSVRIDNGSSSDEILLVIVWAVVLCTIIGPIGVGIIVKRLQRP